LPTTFWQKELLIAFCCFLRALEVFSALTDQNIIEKGGGLHKGGGL